VKFTPQLVIAAVVVIAAAVLAAVGSVDGDAALAVIVSVAGAFGLGASHAATAE
jgi:hypothetical protein